MSHSTHSIGARHLTRQKWHRAQSFPVSKKQVRQLATATVPFMWNGTIFRVRLSTVQRRREDGGLHLLDIEAKCRALFLTKLEDQ